MTHDDAETLTGAQPESAARQVNFCSWAGILIGGSRELPSDPAVYDDGHEPHRGCSRLKCHKCGHMVRSVPASVRNPHAELDHAAMYALPDLAASPLLEASEDWRFYLCQCDHEHVSGQETCDDRDAPWGAARLHWSCAGHAVAELPRDVDGVEVTPATLADVVTRALHGWTPPGASGAKRHGPGWAARLARLFAGTPWQDAIAAAALPVLEDPDPAARSRALNLLRMYRSPVAAERAVALLAGDRRLYAGIPDEAGPLNAKQTQEETLWDLASPLVASPGAARDLARTEALTPAKGSMELYLAVAGGDPDWLAEHVEDIARANPATVDALVEAIGYRLPERIPSKPLIARLRASPDAAGDDAVDETPAAIPQGTVRVEKKDCPTCTALERAEAEGKLNIAVEDDTGGPGLPPEVGRLETFGVDSIRELLRCRDCGTLYRYSSRYEYDAYAPSYTSFEVHRVQDAVTAVVAPLFEPLAPDALDAALAGALRNKSSQVKMAAVLVIQSAPEKAGDAALRALADGLAAKNYEIQMACYDALRAAVKGRGADRAHAVRAALAHLGKKVYNVQDLRSACQEEIDAPAKELPRLPRAEAVQTPAKPPAGEPPPAAPQVAPPPPTDRPPAAPPTAPAALPTAEELRGKSIADLEAEFRRLLSTSRTPPSAQQQVLESYALSTQVADRAQRESAQRTFLVDSIIAHRKPEMQLKPGERISSFDLMGIAARMPIRAESPLYGDIPKHQNALGILINEFDHWTYSPEDGEFHRRLAWVAFINEHAKDPGILEAEERKQRSRS